MLRIFLPLWIIVIVLIIATLTINIFNPVVALQKFVATKVTNDTYRGTFHLITEALEERPETEWDSYIETLSTHFGHRIRLDTEDTLAADIGELPDIGTKRPSLIISKSDDESDYLSLRVGSRNRILTVYLGITEEAESLLALKGSLYLLNQRLLPLPAEQWPTAIENLQPHFGFDLQLRPASSLSLDAEIEARLMRDGVVWVKDETGGEFYYIHYPDQGYVLKVGPIQFDMELAFIAAIFSIVALILGSGLYLGLRPIWKDLSRIDTAATAFGQGKLDQRVDISPRSGLHRLGSSFNAMASRIETLISSHRDLTNAVSHDLRTPLAKLKFAVEMLRDENDPEARARYQHSISHNIDTLEHLINQLLVHSRFMRAPELTNFTQQNLHALLSEEIDQYQDMTDHLTIHLEASAEIQESPVGLDKNAILRAVNNLLSNAVRYAETQIIVRAFLDGNDVCLAVLDDGPGIPEEQRATIFDPFTQLDNAERDSQAGHGLGLAIVKQIALWHQGEIEVGESSLGGAEFMLRWPVGS